MMIMATVMVGSARSDERGKATGGAAGDQTGRELSTQAWYRHSKGWRVLRANDPIMAAKIAQNMKAACANVNIGYDQIQRNTLYNAAKAVGFDCSRVNIKCETDCSALVRVCCVFAGISVGDFYTVTLAARLLATGKFTELKGSQYTGSPNYLQAGDILVTTVKGHAVVILNDGKYAEGVSGMYPTIKLGSTGEAVKRLQNLLISRGYSLPKYGADGDFGKETKDAVERFQKIAELTVDGIVGKKTWAALAEPPERLYRLTITLADKGDLENIQKLYGGEIAEITV